MTDSMRQAIRICDEIATRGSAEESDSARLALILGALLRAINQGSLTDLEAGL